MIFKLTLSATPVSGESRSNHFARKGNHSYSVILRMLLPYSRILSLILFCQLTSASIHSQPDTVVLKKMVTEVSSEKEHLEFWDYIHHRDQDMMIRHDKYIIDQENLISVSYYLNQFGYPDQKYLGRKSQILNYVWVHTVSYEVKKLTFPIILQAYLTGNITEHEDLREYFLQAIYHRYFDDNGHLTKPLSVIIKELGLNVSDKINIESVIRELKNFNELLNQEKKVIGIWKMPDIADTNLLDKKMIITHVEGPRVMMYQLQNGDRYITHVYPEGHPNDPVLQEEIVGNKSSYKSKERITTDYYQITEAGDLKYFDNDGKRVLEYKRE